MRWLEKGVTGKREYCEKAWLRKGVNWKKHDWKKAEFGKGMARRTWRGGGQQVKAARREAAEAISGAESQLEAGRSSSLANLRHREEELQLQLASLHATHEVTRASRAFPRNVPDGMKLGGERVRGGES